jgi:hypothetical protein
VGWIKTNKTDHFHIHLTQGTIFLLLLSILMMDQKVDTVIDNTVNLGDYNENCLQPMIARTKKYPHFTRHVWVYWLAAVLYGQLDIHCRQRAPVGIVLSSSGASQLGMFDIQATRKCKYYDPIVLLYLESRRCRYRSIIFACLYLYVSVVNLI